MVAKSYILSNLKSLDSKYRLAKSQKDNLFFSKLAILELCGWLEESIDEIVKDFAKKHIKNEFNIKLIHNKISQTYGFEYEKHFKSLIIQLVGIVGFERIEVNIDAKKLQLFISSISSLVTRRNSEAHTHIKGATKIIDAPSLTINHFNNIYDGLIEFEKALKSLKI